MKTKEELNALKEEVETVSRKLAELTDEELAEVFGGIIVPPEPPVIEPPGRTTCIYLVSGPLFKKSGI